MTTKSEITNELKKIGFGFVKANADMSGYQKKKLTNNRGIPAGSIGPLSVTTAHVDHNETVKKKIEKTFHSFGFVRDQKNEFGKISFTGLIGKKTVTFSFFLQTYDTYTHSVGLDPSYKTYWWVLGS